MGRAIIAYPNRVDATFYTVAFSGGDWETSLPLSNLRDPLLSAVARSTSVDLADTQFQVDLGIARDIRILAIPKTNLSRAGLWRARASNTPGVFTSPVFDTGWRDAWPVVYPWGTLDWEDPSYWDGRITEESAQGYPMPLVYVHAGAVVARYWLFEFDDTTNAAGFLDIPRLFMSPGWQPSINFQYGAQLGWVNRTAMEETLGGERHYDPRAPRRRFAITLAHLPVDEALVNGFEMQRRQGIDGQVFVIIDPDDTVHMHRRAMLATAREPSPLEWARPQRHNVPLIVEEVL